jgi:uncharacterized repeat protein (TIGR02543 family)
MAALKQRQNASGMWHQLLDRPDSYQETSSTALFVYSMAYGIRQGWLVRADYEPVVTLGWDAVARHIQAHGRVTDICWGGPSRAWTAEDYMNWPKVDGDNHGQGTVLLAAEAMFRLMGSYVTYNVTYDANNATSGTAPAAQTKTQDEALTLAANTGSLARTGYTFAGWNTAADGNGTSYAEGASYTADASATLYAKWTANAQAPAITQFKVTMTNAYGAAMLPGFDWQFRFLSLEYQRHGCYWIRTYRWLCQCVGLSCVSQCSCHARRFITRSTTGAKMPAGCKKHS